MTNASVFLEKVQDSAFPGSKQHAGTPGMSGHCKPFTTAMPIITNGYGTCRNAYRCGCTGYVGWGNGYVCNRCSCGFGDHY